jgi:hypothetical protein
MNVEVRKKSLDMATTLVNKKVARDVDGHFLKMKRA